MGAVLQYLNKLTGVFIGSPEIHFNLWSDLSFFISEVIYVYQMIHQTNTHYSSQDTTLILQRIEKNKQILET